MIISIQNDVGWKDMQLFIMCVLHNIHVVACCDSSIAWSSWNYFIKTNKILTSNLSKMWCVTAFALGIGSGASLFRLILRFNNVYLNIVRCSNNILMYALPCKKHKVHLVSLKIKKMQVINNREIHGKMEIVGIYVRKN